MYDREKVIETLIDDDFLDIGENDYSFFDAILKGGWIGYDNMTDEELIKECEERDIDYHVFESEE